MKHCLNLLPARLQCRILIQARLRRWAYVWGGGVVTALVLYGGQMRRLSDAQVDLQAWQRRAAAVQSVEVRNRELGRKIANLKAHLVKYGHLENEELGYKLLATVSHSAGLCGDKIQVQKMSFKQTQIAVTAPEAKEQTGTSQPASMRDVRILSLAGVALNNLAVAQFNSALRDSAAFDIVELKATQDHRDTISGRCTFQVQCSF